MFQVFVYGTLLPGQSNHRLIEQYVVHRQHGQVGAILFDNGFYPYAILSQNHVTLAEWLSFRDEKEKTLGVLWRITFHDLSALRRREGAPFVYSEKNGYVFATITLKNGVSLQVKVPVLYYLLNEPWVERKPTKEYLAMVESGRKGWLKVIKSTIDG